MKLYAELPRYRVRQLARDSLTLLWIALWARIGVRIHELVAALAGPGRIVEGAGNDLVRSAEEASRGLADVPVIGGALRVPFEAIAGAGRTLHAAGSTQQEVVATLAVWLGICIAAIPIGYALLKYVPDRVRWVREATAAEGIRLDADDLQIFALRAAVNRSLSELRAATPDPGGALAAGDYAALARLELQALGLGAEDVAVVAGRGAADAAGPSNR
jgi:hypothetical protein